MAVIAGDVQRVAPEPEMAFDAVDSEGVPVYHTNVIGCVGTDVALFALQMWAFTVAHELPYDDPERLRARLRAGVRAAGAGALDGSTWSSKATMPTGRPHVAGTLGSTRKPVTMAQ